MPPALAAVVITLAASSIEGVLTGIIIGAVVGAAAAAATGGDIKNGALQGAVSAVAVMGMGALSVGSTGASTAGEAGIESAGAGNLAVDLETGATSTVPSSTSGAASIGNAAASSTPSISTGTSQGSQGILSKAANWVENHPKVMDVAGNVVSGAAEAMLKEDEDKRTIEALMERDRLNREALKVGGLANLDTRSVLPSIGGFLERPKWEMKLDQPSFGILNQQQQK